MQAASSFSPPGPGLWSLDTAHFPRPVTRFVTEVFADPARRGFQEATAGYGLLLDHIEWAFVHRWAYLCPRPVPALAEAGTDLSRREWDDLVASAPALAQRVATSARVFDERRWRDDLREWDERTKPGLRREHLALASTAPSHRDPQALAAYVDRCRENLRRSIYHHHRLNVAPVIPAGDFLVHAAEWTGRPAADLVALVREEGPLSFGGAAELRRAGAAVRDDPEAAAILAGDAPPDAILAALTAHPGPAGAAATDYLDVVGHWSVGSGADVGEPTMREMPHVLVEALRAARDGPSSPAAGNGTADVRSDLPASRRGEFDVLLAEARATHRVRDERAAYCDVWAYGLARRAILAAGHHLAAAGAVEQPEHLVEAGHHEIRTLLAGGPEPTAEDLAARARDREQARQGHAPTTLGGPPRSPVPTEWLEPGAARTERAFRTYVRAMSEEAQEQAGGEGVQGLAASPGRHTGRARVIGTAEELGRVERGDVLVAASTTPAFNAVLPLVGAIVTDRGGLLSHAAIVAREFGIPAVVGTGDATRRIDDGATVVVDGTAGRVDAGR